jgi:ubiquinone/menaquinone biosynthesis C-methylase UbiE
MDKKELIEYYNASASERLKWKKRNAFFQRFLEEYYSFVIPGKSKVLEIGCGTGDLLNAVKPSYGVGIDYSHKMIEIAKERFPHISFFVDDIEDLSLSEKFDYIILSDLIGSLWDIQLALRNVQTLCHPGTRIIISYYNFLWEPVLKLGEWLGLKKKQPLQSWLTIKDIEALLNISDFETIKTEKKLLLPKYVPLLNLIFNTILGNLPLFNLLCLSRFIIARPTRILKGEFSVTIVVPARNERGNIENAILRTPEFGKSQEFIFIEGHSKDGTFEEMLRIKDKYPGKKIEVFRQTGKGKGNAVREGFEKATGEVLMILDADLTMPPEYLPAYYEALASNKGELINGSRLIYPLEKESMRFLNLMGNKFFSILFTYLLGQRLKDTLCGTKVLFKDDYNRVISNRHYFGDFDPFGDFDLLFGAAKLNLKIVEIPIRYKEREYGSTQISRFSHGWLLLKMCAFAARKIKFT